MNMTHLDQPLASIYLAMTSYVNWVQIARVLSSHALTQLTTSQKIHPVPAFWWRIHCILLEAVIRPIFLCKLQSSSGLLDSCICTTSYLRILYAKDYSRWLSSVITIFDVYFRRLFFDCRCGRKQSGGYLDGVAPDGLMGLGLGKVSVLSVLAKSGLVRNSFSLCFDDDDSGRLFFGDQGPAGQHSTPFLPSGGK